MTIRSNQQNGGVPLSSCTEHNSHEQSNRIWQSSGELRPRVSQSGLPFLLSRDHFQWSVCDALPIFGLDVLERFLPLSICPNATSRH